MDLRPDFFLGFLGKEVGVLRKVQEMLFSGNFPPRNAY